MAWGKGLRKVICEFDSIEVVHFLHLDVILESIPFKDLLLEIRNLMQKNWDIQLVHVLREANSVADRLAKGAVAMADDYTFWDSPPADVLPFLV
ncbi:Ribonuclease H-like superfamily [Sesbania bispinosa]|nr:Ribonuclease H-like superfamily [Sesbania bispinosa]